MMKQKSYLLLDGKLRVDIKGVGSGECKDVCEYAFGVSMLSVWLKFTLIWKREPEVRYFSLLFGPVIATVCGIVVIARVYDASPFVYTRASL